MKYNIFVIGFGNIGFRHVEALLKVKQPINIYIIEQKKA